MYVVTFTHAGSIQIPFSPGVFSEEEKSFELKPLWEPEGEEDFLAEEDRQQALKRMGVREERRRDLGAFNDIQESLGIDPANYAPFSVDYLGVDQDQNPVFLSRCVRLNEGENTLLLSVLGNASSPFEFQSVLDALIFFKFIGGAPVLHDGEPVLPSDRGGQNTKWSDLPSLVEA